MITSILDTDLYKLTMQNAVIQHFPRADAEYHFINRGHQRFTQEFLSKFDHEIKNLRFIRLTIPEKKYLKDSFPFLPESYIDYLSNYQFDVNQLKYGLTKDNNFELSIIGPWRDAILWEVPVLALISEIYFKHVDKNWKFERNLQALQASSKLKYLSNHNCDVIEFGTRRRRSSLTQLTFLQEAEKFKISTSNVFFAKKLGLKCLGTNAHEWYQAISKLVDLEKANFWASLIWRKTYPNDLKIALTDTFGLEAFLKDFDKQMAENYSGLRQDSGNQFLFIDKVLEHYKKLGIDARNKTLLFSDNLNDMKAVEIQKYVANRAKCVFGIGTNFTNDYKYQNSYPLNMVIKLYSINNQYVTKLSDDIGKECGHPDAIAEAKKIFGR